MLTEDSAASTSRFERFPWLTVWCSPRHTVRRCSGSASQSTVIFLGAIGGVGQAMARGASNDLGLRVPAWAILGGSLIIGSIVGVIQLYGITTLLYWTGRLTGANASFRKVSIVVGLANAPWAASLILWLLATLFVGRHLFVRDPFSVEYATAWRSLVAEISAVLVVLCSLLSWVWSFTILVFGLAEVNGFSALRALLDIFIAACALGSLLLLLIPTVMHFIHR